MHMARKLQTNPRKSASQERSRATVDALLEATARFLMKEGYDRASTNRIAEVAGVNISSLYQYFPSKEALVAAVIDRHLETLRTTLRATFEARPDAALEEQVRGVFGSYLALARAEPALHKVLIEQVPRVE